MKIQAKATTTVHHVIDGEISAEELLKMVTQTLQLPSGATLSFYVEVVDHGKVEVDLHVPLRFRAEAIEEREEPRAPEPVMPRQFR